jgi:hypothetical protein
VLLESWYRTQFGFFIVRSTAMPFLESMEKKNSVNEVLIDLKVFWDFNVSLVSPDTGPGVLMTS